MGRNIVAGIAGILIAVALVWLVEKVGHAVYPLPADLDLSSAEAMEAYIAGLPLGALLFVATIANLAMIPHPVWFSALGILGILIGAWLGTMCERATAGNDA